MVDVCFFVVGKSYVIMFEAVEDYICANLVSASVAPEDKIDGT
jgi:hypothetical protein